MYTLIVPKRTQRKPLYSDLCIDFSPLSFFSFSFKNPKAQSWDNKLQQKRKNIQNSVIYIYKFMRHSCEQCYLSFSDASVCVHSPNVGSIVNRNNKTIKKKESYNWEGKENLIVSLIIEIVNRATGKPSQIVPFHKNFFFTSFILQK